MRFGMPMEGAVDGSQELEILDSRSGSEMK
jgi:hypothetical protein